MANVKYSAEQQKVAMQIVRLTQTFTNNMRRIMRNHGLDQVDGADLTITVVPSIKGCEQVVSFGSVDSEAGYIVTAKGSEKLRGTGYEDWHIADCEDNSREYEELLASQKLRKPCPEGKQSEKPLPPDGLWLSSRDDCPFLDCGV